MTSAPGVAESLASLDPARLRDGWDRAILGEACGAATAYLKGAGGPQGANEVAGYVESLSEVRNVAGKPADVQSALQALVRKHAASSPPYASAIPSMPGTLRAIVHSESRFTAARLALDLEGYRQSRGVYPQTLDALGTPLPVDPASGLRFTYRCEGEGFVLESSESQRVLWRTRP
jgi:hypothetical protein